MSKQQVTVPDIGGAEGAEVVELLVAVGDEVVLEQSLIVLESDKASMEIPSTTSCRNWPRWRPLQSWWPFC